jgi:hypothetical protein
MGRVCSTNGDEEECILLYWWERQKERDYEEDNDVGGWTMLKWILER